MEATIASTSFGTNDALTNKLWSKTLNAEVLKSTWIMKFVGSSASDIIQEKEETSRYAGDKVTYGLRMQMTGGGVAGDSTLEGNEEALTFYNDSVLIDQLRNAHKIDGRMAEQRVPYDLRMEGMEALRDWWADRMDAWGFNQLCGYVPQTDLKYTGHNAIVAPDADHIIRPASGEAADQSISTTSTFVLSMIDKAVERAKTLTPAIRPVRVNGKPMYVVFVHPYQSTDIRTSTSTGQWLDITKSAMQGGQIDDNPIYSGHLGTYNGCILHEDSRVTNGVNGSTSLAVTAVRRAVFLGAQAGVMAYGRGYSGAERFDWVEETMDYRNKRGVSAGLIGGLKKARFNSTDYATIVLSTYGAAH